MPTKESRANFDKLLSKFSPAIRALTKKTRALVLEIFPDAAEKTYFGWSNTWYGSSAKTSDAVFSVSPMKTHVQLYFLRGTELPDPAKLLEGTGKKLRHVNIREAVDLKRPALRRLMKRAVAHHKQPRLQSKKGRKQVEIPKSKAKSKK